MGNQSSSTIPENYDWDCCPDHDEEFKRFLQENSQPLTFDEINDPAFQALRPVFSQTTPNLSR